MTRRQFGFFVPVFALAWGGCSAPGSLSNREAGAVIERLWNNADVGLVLGHVTFVSAGPDTSKGRDSVREWPVYEAFARNGVLTVQNVRDLTGQFTGWNDFLALTQGDVRKTATVAATEHGKSKGTIKRVGDFDELWIKVASTKVESIAANDEDVVGTDKYRVVVGTHTYSVPDEMSAAFETARGWDHVPERRFKVLLKFDPIDKDWKMVTADIGKRSEDFHTNQVSQMLQSLKMGAR